MARALPKYVTGADIETNSPVNKGIKQSAQPKLDDPSVDEAVDDIVEVEDDVSEVVSDDDSGDVSEVVSDDDSDNDDAPF